jgi:HEPN domain-containing protein
MMAKKIPTRPINKQDYNNYWKKAKDFYRGMSQSYIDSNWNSTSLEGIHATISAADAVLIFSRGYKSSSQKHIDVTSLISDLPLDGAKQAAGHISRVVSIKNIVEYTGEDHTSSEAQEVIKHVERFFNWVRKVLPK